MPIFMVLFFVHVWDVCEVNLRSLLQYEMKHEKKFLLHAFCQKSLFFFLLFFFFLKLSFLESMIVKIKRTV